MSLAGASSTAALGLTRGGRDDPHPHSLPFSLSFPSPGPRAGSKMRRGLLEVWALTGRDRVKVANGAEGVGWWLRETSRGREGSLSRLTRALGESSAPPGSTPPRSWVTLHGRSFLQTHRSFSRGTIARPMG